MTEIEAIEVLKKEKKCNDIDDLDGCPVDECRKCPYRVTEAELDEAYDMAIESLRETGHVERCVLDETKVVKLKTEIDGITGESYESPVCPKCGIYLSAFYDYCPWCGQALDWSEVKE